MATPYPHKQTVVIFILCAVVVIAAAAFVHGNKALQNDQKGTVAIHVSTSTVANPYIETNSDWQKSFYVHSTSSPVKKAATTATAASANAKLSATDKFGREFFEEFANLKKAGKLEDADAVSAATQKLISQGALLADAPDVYSLADIRVGTSDDLAAYKEYGNKIGTLMKLAPAHNDAYVVSKGLQSGTDSYLKEIDSNIVKYKSIIEQMLEMRVPPSLRQDHLDFTNGISATLFIATSLRASPTDPIKALLGMDAIEPTTTLLFETFQSIRLKLSDMGVTYSTGEPGSYFKLKP